MEKLTKNMFKRIWAESHHSKAKDSTQNESQFYRQLKDL